jgi:hypothetical protein
MQLSALAAALHGIGFGTLLMALQGLWEATVVPDPLPMQQGGGAGVPAAARRRVGRRRVVKLLDEMEQDDEEAMLALSTPP